MPKKSELSEMLLSTSKTNSKKKLLLCREYLSLHSRAGSCRNPHCAMKGDGADFYMILRRIKAGSSPSVMDPLHSRPD